MTSLFPKLSPYKAFSGGRIMTNVKGTKVKKMNEVAVTGVKDVDFGELELKIAKPTLNADKTISIGGNFSDLGSKIQVLVDRYKGTKLTEDNVDYVKTLKGQFASLRLGVDRERREYKKVYITPASKLIDSMCDELLQIIASGETALGDQLEEYDQRRKNELTIILTDYVNDAVAKYKLRPEYASQIVLIDKYYNKTQKEEDSIDDIERQAQELSKKQTEHDSAVVLIQTECQDADLLPDSYIRELEYKSAMEIILEIKQDKKAKAEMKAKIDNGEKIVIGADTDSEIAKQMEKATAIPEDSLLRTRTLRVVYKPENAKALAKALKELCVKFDFI